MKKYIASAAASCLLALTATSALAGNAQVENALKSRPDLSTFYNGLVSTGVINELHEGQPYTIFAPTNEAFNKIPAAKYPCFYSSDCKAQVAAVLRNHIVPGEKHEEDVSEQSNNREGGIMSMFTISNQHLVMSEPFKGQYAVDGRKVLSENQLFGGELYRIDGVLASDHDLAALSAPVVVTVAGAPAPLPPRVPAGEIVTITTTDSSTPVPQ